MNVILNINLFGLKFLGRRHFHLFERLSSFFGVKRTWGWLWWMRNLVKALPWHLARFQKLEIEIWKRCTPRERRVCILLIRMDQWFFELYLHTGLIINLVRFCTSMWYPRKETSTKTILIKIRRKNIDTLYEILDTQEDIWTTKEKVITTGWEEISIFMFSCSILLRSMKAMFNEEYHWIPWTTRIG